MSTVEAIQVHIRVRPLVSDQEIAVKDTCVRADGESIEVTEPLPAESSRMPRKFRCDFDSVLGPDVSQLHIYAKVGKPCANAVLKGYNATIFAYGQTGSGKTHTMFGQDHDGECSFVQPLSRPLLFTDLLCSCVSFSGNAARLLLLTLCMPFKRVICH